ncbi:hypothetical protein SSYM_0864 [Serratia symbiotica str. Tucson]|uniref:Uncharacterized protein n=1 Tax=Serratia symbiotica str. Tucson TaxID=914128 RepID=E9CKZ7_9GAMM|nr:hypothetical protein SSYM_0864 [Serratia symbiotica str. Tucson]
MVGSEGDPLQIGLLVFTRTSCYVYAMMRLA